VTGRPVPTAVAALSVEAHPGSAGSALYGRAALTPSGAAEVVGTLVAVVAEIVLRGKVALASGLDAGIEGAINVVVALQGIPVRDAAELLTTDEHPVAHQSVIARRAIVGARDDAVGIPVGIGIPVRVGVPIGVAVPVGVAIGISVGV